MSNNDDVDQMIRAVNFRFLCVWLFMVIGILLIGAGAGFLGIGILVPDSGLITAFTATLCAFIATILVALSWTSSCALHYVLWKVVPPQIARTTPGKALGFCFIPFFNWFYWNFVSLVGLSKDINEALRQRGINLYVSTGLPLTYCLLILLNIFTAFIIDISLLILEAMEIEVGAIGTVLSLLSNISGYVISFIALIVLILFYKSVKDGAVALLEAERNTLTESAA